MSELELDMEHGRRAVAEVRRTIWPERGGNLPDEPTQDEMNRYVEELETALAGKAMAMRMVGGLFRP